MMTFLLRRTTTAAVAAAGIALTACAADVGAPDAAAPPTAEQVAAVGTLEVHRTATCACCGAWEDLMADAGFDLEVTVVEDLSAAKDRAGVPDGAGSCHTTFVDGYALEGHMPAHAIVKLVEERPDVDGITVPGMPAGSPGMGGDPDTAEPFDVLTFTGGQLGDVFTVG
jgi:hypothetical protein